MALQQSVSTVQQACSADRVNVFISSQASRVQSHIHCSGGNAFWCPSKNLSETCAVGRPESVRGLSQMITVSQRVTGTARCCGLLRHYLLNPVFSSKETRAISKWLWGNHTPCQKPLAFCLRNKTAPAKVFHQFMEGKILCWVAQYDWEGLCVYVCGYNICSS